MYQETSRNIKYSQYLLLFVQTLRYISLYMCVIVDVFVTEVIFLRAVAALRPDVQIVIEQPSGSFMFKHPMWHQLVQDLRMSFHTTWMGLFGLSMLKPTKLCSNMPCLDCIIMNFWIWKSDETWCDQNEPRHLCNNLPTHTNPLHSNDMQWLFFEFPWKSLFFFGKH